MDSWNCPLCCSKQFKSKIELIAHLQHISSNLNCPICKHQLLDLSSLILHLQNQCGNGPQISFEPNNIQNGTPVHQSAHLESNKHLTAGSQSSLNSTAVSSREKVILLRKRKRSNLNPFGNRKSFGKNNNSNDCTSLQSQNLSNQEAIPSSSFAETLVLENSSQGTSRHVNNPAITSVTDSLVDSNTATELISSIISQNTQSSTAESEIDLDNISMLSDESSFTTNDYSSSQNEILSDEDCADNAVVPHRVPFHPSNTRLSRNNAMQNSGNNMFINNLEVINNNFYTIVLNNGSYEGNAPCSNTLGEGNGNFQRRNTKNNNSQFNNNCNSSEHTVPHNVSMHNNLQGNRSCKNSNLTSVHNATTASSTTTLPGTSLFKISNNSPNKYAVKNTNITNYIPGSSKEVTTASLENRSCTRTSGSVENSNVTAEDTAQTMQDDGSARTSPVTEHTSDMVQENVENPQTLEPSTSSQQGNHPLVSRSTSSRMQKIQNIDCIQNFASSLVLNPSTSALCKTNSFPLCNYIRTQEGADKCKLIKYNVNASGKLSISPDNEVLNNTQTHPVPGHENTMSMVTNDIASEATESQNIVENTSPASEDTQNTLTLVENEGSASRYEATDIYETTASQVNNKNVCDNSEQSKVSVSLGPGLAKSRSLDTNQASGSEQTNQRSVTTSVSLDLSHVEGEADDPSVSGTLNNLNNSINTIPTSSQNICSLNNNLHRNKKSNLNQLGRRNVNKEEKLFTDKKESTRPQSTGMTSETNASGSYPMINNSIERNFNKLNTCSQEINAHKNVKPSQNNRKCKKSRKQVGSVASCSSPSVVSATSTAETNTNVTATASSSSRTETTPSSNLSQDMNNSTTSNSSRLVFKNNHHAMNTDATDKNISKMFNKKDLLNIKRNNFDFGTQEHSNVKRSNSLHVKVNDLASSTSQPDIQHRTITKSNSFSIRNNITDPDTSQGRTKKQNYSNELNTKENCLKDLKNNINRRLESVDLNADAGSVSSENNADTVETYARDALEPFRLEEATNDIPDILTSNEDIDLVLNEATSTVPSDHVTYGSEVLNNVDTHTLHGNKPKPGTSSHSGSGAASSPQMIHNNIEPRCKKNKKCNEEREPLKPINSDNRRKPTEE